MLSLDRLRPGESADLPAPGDDKLKPDSRWQANVHRYQLYQSLMLGGSRMLMPPSGTAHPITGGGLKDNSYLRRLPGESAMGGTNATGEEDAWVRRRDGASHDPVSSRIVWTYVDTFFRQHVDRSSVIDALGQDVYDNVDMRGTGIDDWLPSAYAQGLAHGWVIGLVDLPPVEEEFASLEHEKAAGLRPYVQLITPIRVWKLEQDDFGAVTYALIHEGPSRWREWTADGCRLLDEDGNVLESKQHSFGKVPMVIFRANDPDPDDETAPVGESAMAATSLVDLQILQHLSLLDDIQRKTGFPFLHVQRDQETIIESDTTLGADYQYYIDASVDWKAPPDTCTQEVRAHIQWLESLALKIGGVHRRSMDSVEAHSGLALDWENAPIYSIVHRWARRLRAWELQLWGLMAEALGKRGTIIEVSYPDDFSSRPVDQDLEHAKSIMDLYAGSPPPWAKVVVDALVRRVGRRLVGHLPDVASALPPVIEVEEKPEPPPMMPGEEPPFGPDDGPEKAFLNRQLGDDNA